MTANKEKKRDKVFRLLEKSLGTDTDKSIAKKVGCSASYVGKLRKYDFWKKEPLQDIACPCIQLSSLRGLMLTMPTN